MSTDSTQEDIQPSLPDDLDEGSDELAQVDLVVVGSSAGGIEALTVLLSTLRPGFPAPIVLAQHVDPRRPSNLEAVLQRRTPIPIVLVTDKVPLEPGKIYIVPSNRHIAISDSHVHIEGDHADRPRPSVDLLLSTAAESYGERLVAIILTGSGNDGASGAIDVKNAGGVVIIQDPDTARFPSMPLALPPAAVDFKANVEEIGQLLYDLISGEQLRGPVEKTEDPLRNILAFVSAKSNIDFNLYKPGTILRRIGRRMVTTHIDTIENYSLYLQEHPEEVAELVMAFLIKVTEFFRDTEAFAFLKTHILPDLIESNKDKSTLRVWSAGCATGEEPFSIALIVAELLGPDLPKWNVKIFATDLDEGAIAFARRAFYPASMLKNMPEQYVGRYFEQVDGGYRVSKLLRQMVIFGNQDLSRGAPFPRMDLVVCRNLLIYFKPPLQQQILDRFAYSLARAGGYLFLGNSETARPATADFVQVHKKWKVYRCTTSPIAALRRPSSSSALSDMARQLSLKDPESGPLARQILGLGSPGSPNGDIDADQASQPRAKDSREIEPHREDPARLTDLEIQILRRTNEIMFRFSPVGTAIVDRNYRVITINMSARRLLHIHDLRPENDFLHSARALPYSIVRSAIDSAFRERAGSLLPEVELDPLVGDGKYVSLSIAPVEVAEGLPNLALINIQDATEAVQIRKHLETVQAEQEHLVTELQDANSRLNDMNTELQDTNEELQAANEEMMLTQEELQATNEEFETSNEELQATNEELETSNEELQATNEELETTNEELNSRTDDLQELSRRLADERVRLTDMVGLAPFYIWVFRGESLLLEATNPHSQRLSRGHDLTNRPVEEVLLDQHLSGGHSSKLVKLVHEAYQQNQVRESASTLTMVPSEETGPEERYFSFTIVPTRRSDGMVDGVVVYGEDVTDRLARQAEESLSILKLMVEHADQVALAIYDAETTRLLQASPRYIDVLERVCGYSRDTIIGRTWEEMPFAMSNKDAQEMFRSTASTGETRHLREVRIVPPSNEEEYSIWDLSLAPILTQQAEQEGDGAGSIVTAGFVVISAVEITEQVEQRHELERLDQLRDQFLSLASHELRTPLVPLMGYSDLLNRLAARKEKEADPTWDPRVGEYVGKFKTHLQHMTRLIDDLFDVARLQTGKFTLRQKQVDLRRILDKAADSASMLSGTHTINCDVKGKGSFMVEGDEERLIQVVLNLLQNAIRYAPESDRIDVRMRREAAKGKGKGKSVAVIEVQDYGPGISAEALPSIFARFYQASHEPRAAHNGLGLGLFIVKAIAEQHGGTVNAKSSPGQGSTFTVTLPLL